MESNNEELNESIKKVKDFIYENRATAWFAIALSQPEMDFLRLNQIATELKITKEEDLLQLFINLGNFSLLIAFFNHLGEKKVLDS